MTVQFNGADQLAKLERDLAAAADRLSRTIARTVGRELDPLPEAVRQSALRILPRKGGLAGLVAGRVVPRKEQRPGSVRVFSVGKKGLKELVRLDKGSVRHPVHADPRKTRAEWHWVNQPVNKNFWTRPVKLREDEIKKAVKAALDALAKEI